MLLPSRQRFLFIMIAICLFFGISNLSSAGKKSGEDIAPPQEVVKTFRDLLFVGKVDDALTLILDPATPPPGGAENRREVLAQFSQRMAAGKQDFTPLDAKISGSAAVVVIQDKNLRDRLKRDIDPMFLFQDAGEWKILFSPQNPDSPTYDFDKGTLKQYQDLEEWFQEWKRGGPFVDSNEVEELGRKFVASLSKNDPEMFLKLWASPKQLEELAKNPPEGVPAPPENQIPDITTVRL